MFNKHLLEQLSFFRNILRYLQTIRNAEGLQCILVHVSISLQYLMMLRGVSRFLAHSFCRKLLNLMIKKSKMI